MAKLSPDDQHLLTELPKVSTNLRAEADIWAKSPESQSAAANTRRMADNVDLAIRRIKALSDTNDRLTKRLGKSDGRTH